MYVPRKNIINFQTKRYEVGEVDALMVYDTFHKSGGRWYTWGEGGLIILRECVCLFQVIKSFQNYGGVATGLHPTLVF
jgi:hypothetical protein